MKKITVLGLCLLGLGTLGANAQLSLVKDAERAAKSGATFASVLEMVTPAFTNEETAKDAKAYYVPGLAAIKEYDQLLGLKSAGLLKEDDARRMNSLLLEANKYFQKALPLDSLPDAKGKIKPRVSKDIYNQLAGHLEDYINAGVEEFNNNKNYAGAYDLWDVYVNLAQNPELVKKYVDSTGKPAPTNEYLGELIFNQAQAAMQQDKYQDMIDVLKKARAMGYTQKATFDYALWAAQHLNDTDQAFEIASEALPLYGSEDSNYMANIINYYLVKEQNDKAFEIVNAALAEQPDNDAYYVIQGVLYEASNDNDKALETFKKAAEINPKNANALYNYGRMLCNQAYAVSDAAPADPKASEAYYNEKIKPLFLQAVEVLENAYNVNLNDPNQPSNHDILKYLENAYYNLHDEKMLEDVQNR